MCLPWARSVALDVQPLRLIYGTIPQVTSEPATAQHLSDLDHAVDCDVLVCGDDRGACEAARMQSEKTNSR